MPAFDFPSAPSLNDIYTPMPGVSYQFDGTTWRIYNSVIAIPVTSRVTKYTPGTYGYVKPANLREVIVELFGGGGGSGGCAATAGGQSSAGGGGGGGAYCRKRYLASELSSSEPLVVGIGGTNGTSSTPGGDGAGSTFKSMVAGPGEGGAAGTAQSTLGFSTSRGAGGTASGGDFHCDGSSGQPGLANHSNTGRALPGFGGMSFQGGTYFPTIVTGQSTPSDQSNIGRGANGAANGASQSAIAGADGGPGHAIFTEILWDADYVETAPLISSVRRVVMENSGDYTKPVGLKFLEVELVGTGGNGGSAAATAAGQSSAGGGGGGGAYCRRLYAAGDLASIEPVVIGAVGAGSGNAGGDSTFKSMVAQGGAGGASVAAGTTLAQATSANGGIAAGGDVNVDGGWGHAGLRAAHGSATTASPGDGGMSMLAPRTGRLQILTSTAAGEDGRGYGGGGGGGANGASQSLAAGGFGSKGVAILTEYY